MKQLFLTILLVMVLGFSGSLFAQAETEQLSNLSDTAINKPIIKYLLKNPSSWIQNNINKLNSTAVNHPPSIDTLEIISKLKRLSNSNALIRQNLQYNTFSLRYRQVSDLYNELMAEIEDLKHIQKKVSQYNNYLIRETSIAIVIEKEIDFFNKNADSTIIAIYRPEIELLDSTVQKTSNYFTGRLRSLVRLEDSINSIALRLQGTNRFAQTLMRDIQSEQGKATLPPIWNSKTSDYPQSLGATIHKTFDQTIDSILFFMRHSVTRLILYRVLILIICFLPVHYFRKHKDNMLTGMHTQKYLQKYPNLASLIMGLAVAPLIFKHAPFAFLDLIFISLTICVGIIYLKEHAYISRLPFLVLLFSFIILKLINFFSTPTFAGRIIYCSAILLIIPIYHIYNDLLKHSGEKQKKARIIFILLLLQLTLGWVLIVIGYYPLGRQLFLGAKDAFILALVLSVTVFTFIDYLRIVTYMINKKSKSIKIDHEIIEKSLKKIIIALAGVFFVISYLKNIGIFDEISNWLITFVNEQRQLGNSEFTYGSILLFFAIVSGTIYLANLLNTAIVTDDNKLQFRKRSRLGGIMLMVRFAVITAGFIIGVIASGVPITQITVLMGALGVGIGFGLQNIFNNLVSGLIIAIEKPVSVGDMVELGTDSGWIKEIGIRSSNLQTYDGAEVIVPNGELISNKVTNWTLSNKRRRMELQIGVSYKSDPHLVRDLFQQILSEHKEILKNPEPYLLFTGLGESSLNFSLYFWVSDFAEAKRIRSEVLFRVFDVLKEHHIEIPFPQRDIHLYTKDLDDSINSVPKSIS
ncbi:MAG: mechanosensitive ion channel family protein [Bacteroidales bacterium]